MPSTPRPRHRDRERTHQRTPRQSTPPLPTYQPPLASLNTAGQTALLNLLTAQSLRQLKTHIQHASEKLVDAAGEVNERLTDARVREAKTRARRRRDRDEEGEGGSPGVEDEESGEAVRELEGKVRVATEMLEAQMRGTIDAEVRVDGLLGVLGGFEREVEEGAGASGGRRGGRRRRGLRRGGGKEEEEDEEEEDEAYSPTPELPTSEALSHKLDAGLEEKYSQWDNLSLTQRYSANNAYIGFYRIIHEAKHPGDEMPPLPHASTWFAHLEDPTTASSSPTRRTRTRRSPSPASSDDLAIERERISLKCPLTLLPFQDPVTSTKCHHSFEREAIEGMLSQSSTTVPGPVEAGKVRAKRVRSIKCPVCSEVLTGLDLRADPVLLRRVRKVQAAVQREEEEEEEAAEEQFQGDGERRKRSRKSGITVGSGDEEEEEDDEEDDEDMEDDGEPRAKRQATDHVRIKQELSSTAPGNE